MVPNNAPMVLSRFVGDPGALQHDAHEHEQRHGEQDLVGHDAKDAVRDEAEEGQVERAQPQVRLADRKIRETPPRVKATGKPAISPAQTPPNSGEREEFRRGS